MQSVISARSLRALLILAFSTSLALFTSQAAIAAQPDDNPGAEQDHGAPSDFQLDENEGDPIGQFNRWRNDNRVSLPTTPAVMRAHHQWAAKGGAKGGGGGGSCHGNKCGGGGGSAESPAPTTGVLNNVNAGSNLSGYQGEMSIAVDPTDSAHLVAGANTFYQDPTPACQAPSGSTYGTQALYESTDNGTTWTYACAPWPQNLTGGAGPYYFGSDPSMAFGPDGTAYVSYMLLSQDASGQTITSSIVVAKKGPNDANWTPYGIVSNHYNDSSLFDDKNMTAVDTSGGAHNGRVYVIWDINNVEKIAYSDDGSTWTTKTLETTSDYNVGGELAVASDGTVYAVWNRLIYGNPRSETDETTVMATSTDGGSTWSTPSTITHHNLLSFGSNNLPPAQDQRGVNAFPALDIDHSNGALYLVYDDFPSGVTSGNDLNVYLRKSTDGGATWSTAQRINQDTGTSTQFFPWVGVDQSNGTVTVSWYDTREDSTDRKARAYMAFSKDGGSSFTERKVAIPTSQFANSSIDYSDENSSDNVNYNGNQYGDYAQIATAAGYAHLFWTDSRAFYPGNTASGAVEEAAAGTVDLRNQ